MTRNIFFFSDNKELYNSLNRAFQEDRYTYLKPIEDIEKFEVIGADQSDVFLFLALDRDKKYKWLWDEIRIGLKAVNPVIIMGFHKITSTEDLRDLVFEQQETKPSHKYLQIPFDMKDLLKSVHDARAISKKDLPGFIEKFSNWKSLLRTILKHDLPTKLMKGDKDSSIELYKRAKERLLILGKYQDMISLIDDEINSIDTQDLFNKYNERVSSCKKIWSLLSE